MSYKWQIAIIRIMILWYDTDDEAFDIEHTHKEI